MNVIYRIKAMVEMSALKAVDEIKHFILRDLRIFLLQSDSLHYGEGVLLRGDEGIADSGLWDGTSPRAEIVPFSIARRC